MGSLRGEYAAYDGPGGLKFGTARINEGLGFARIVLTRNVNREGKEYPDPVTFVYFGIIAGRKVALFFRQKGARDRVGAAILRRTTQGEMLGYATYFEEDSTESITKEIFLKLT
ncbi:hypothetical protein [Rathayibacter caricis]|uniref:hypothetical protein n=1 Tax=Rathayibacter caricis TaxID=110936 RepID=UPI0011B22AB8|nr:hypothetical protein [Rathayibacter caricis]